MFQRPHPLKSHVERRNLRKNPNFSELEVDPRSLRWRLNKDALVGIMKTGVKGAQKNGVWRTRTLVGAAPL